MATFYLCTGCKNFSKTDDTLSVCDTCLDNLIMRILKDIQNGK